MKDYRQNAVALVVVLFIVVMIIKVAKISTQESENFDGSMAPIKASQFGSAFQLSGVTGVVSSHSPV